MPSIHRCFARPVMVRSLGFCIMVLVAWGPLPCPSLAGEQNPPTASNRNAMSIETQTYGKTPDGQTISQYVCRNQNGLVVKLIDYGAIVTSVEVPDRDGKRQNITLGFPSLDGYLQRHPYFGATVGRFANRIAGGQFTLDGRQYRLARNNEPNHLHGGERGFDRVVWQAEPVKNETEVGVRFRYLSTDGEEGYPGNLDVTALYLLTSDDELRIEFTATTDKPTPVNLTNHNYWNLAGEGSGAVLDHVLVLHADKYLPVDETLIPTGELAAVANTPMDFTEPKEIGRELNKLAGDPQGYDHCYVIRGQAGELRLAARVKDPESGRVMEVYTTQPGVQLYTGNFLDGSDADGGYPQYGGFCLETQHFPDSPNQPDFPNTILRPGETYRHVTVHRFLAE